MKSIESLINDVNNKKYRYIKITKVSDMKATKHSSVSVVRRIIRSNDEKVVSVSNLVSQKLEITRRFPTDTNRYRLIDDGYVEAVECGIKYGDKYVEVKFLKDLPWSKSATKNT